MSFAACSLYCDNCYKMKNGKCPGCFQNEKASWCKIRSCCIEHGYESCADCKVMPLEECRKFNNVIGKIFSFVFKSDRNANIRRIQEVGYEQFADELKKSGLMSLKRK